MKNKKRTLILVAAILLLAIVSIGTYAIYKSSATGTSGFKTAGWYIELNGEDIRTSNTFSFDLKDADWTHTTNITPNDDTVQVIAPGSSGTYGIEIDTEGTEVNVEYSINFVVKQNDTVVDISKMNSHMSMGLYKDDTLLINPKVGIITAGEKENFEIKINWEEVDNYSNYLDNNIEDTNFTIEVTVATKQASKPEVATTVINGVEGLVEVAGAKRYVGATPDNYVIFNDEIWRIIGVYGNQLKIIKNTSMGRVYFQPNYQLTNKWDLSNAKNQLNGTYYDSLSEEATSMIVDGTWNIGGTSKSSTAAKAYTDSLEETWTGKVGLMTTYEYLYGASVDCHTYSDPSYGYSTACANKNWLHLTSNDHYWTMTASLTEGYNNNSELQLRIDSSGNVNTYIINTDRHAFPAVYLSSNVKIIGGSGSVNSPYILSL